MRAGRRKQQRRGRRAAIRVVGVGSACWNALGSQRSTFRQMAKDVALLASIRVAVGGMMRISFINVVVPLVVLAVTVIWRYGVQIATMTESGAVACATLAWKILGDVMPACSIVISTQMALRRKRVAVAGSLQLSASSAQSLSLHSFADSAGETLAHIAFAPGVMRLHRKAPCSCVSADHATQTHL